MEFKKMEIPATTPDKPYIEFRIDKEGKIKLSATSGWWGGKNSRFVSSDGCEGNTAPPKQLESYIKAFKKRKIKRLEKEIVVLQKRLNKLKQIPWA